MLAETSMLKNMHAHVAYKSLLQDMDYTGSMLRNDGVLKKN